MTQLETKPYSNIELTMEANRLRGKLKNLAIQTQMFKNLLSAITKCGGFEDNQFTISQSAYLDTCADLQNDAFELVIESDEKTIKLKYKKKQNE